MRHLIYADHRYHYRGPLNAPAFCLLRIFAGKSNPEFVTVLLTEVYGNTGVSTTNFFERLATQISREFPQHIPVPRLAAWIDHFALGCSFHRVHMRENGGFFDQPSWERLTEDDLADYLPAEVWQAGRPQPIVEILDREPESIIG